MTSFLIVGGLIAIGIVAFIAHLIKAVKHGTSDDNDPNSHRFFKWFCDKENPQQKYYKTVVKTTTKQEEDVEKALEESDKKPEQ